MHKLGVIVPYRNRTEHLNTFVERMTAHLLKSGIENEIIVVHQNDATQFNRGKLLNIGFVTAESLGCDYVVFHDVDMVPIEADYSYCDHPVHLATDFVQSEGESKRIVFEQYFGGVTMFPCEQFRRINGYSNNYWGCGYEDDDLLLRCKRNGLSLSSLSIENNGKSGQYIKFSGHDSFVEGNNEFNPNGGMTVLVNFYPNGIYFDPTKDSDMYTVFSIPGYDFSISYTSFLRYNFCIFDSDKNPIYVNSSIKREHLTTMGVSINGYEKTLDVFQDGKLVGSGRWEKKLYPYTKEKKFYVGAGNPDRDSEKRNFAGYFKDLVIIDEPTDTDEMIRLTKSPLSDVRGKNVVLHYDADFVNGEVMTDVSGNGNHGKMKNCQIINLEVPECRKLYAPHRRKSLFWMMPHGENGFVGTGWKDKATRWNQLRFYNEALRKEDIAREDGLSELSYRTIKRSKEKNLTYINVGL